MMCTVFKRKQHVTDTALTIKLHALTKSTAKYGHVNALLFFPHSQKLQLRAWFHARHPLHAKALAKMITHGELPGIVCDNLKHENEIIRGHYYSNYYFKSPNKKSSWNAILWSIAPPMPTFKKKNAMVQLAMVRLELLMQSLNKQSQFWLIPLHAPHSQRKPQKKVINKARSCSKQLC